jgi:hypothetical protein
MSDNPLTDIRNALADISARMATREDLDALRSDLRGEIAQTRGEIIKTRAEIMARIDRLQDAVSLQHEERIVDVGSAERTERMAKAAQEDAAAIGKIVTPLVRLVHHMRTQLDDLSEEVRLLKERPTS